MLKTIRHNSKTNSEDCLYLSILLRALLYTCCFCLGQILASTSTIDTNLTRQINPSWTTSITIPQANPIPSLPNMPIDNSYFKVPTEDSSHAMTFVLTNNQSDSEQEALYKDIVDNGHTDIIIRPNSTPDKSIATNSPTTSLKPILCPYMALCRLLFTSNCLSITVCQFTYEYNSTEIKELEDVMNVYINDLPKFARWKTVDLIIVEGSPGVVTTVSQLAVRSPWIGRLIISQSQKLKPLDWLAGNQWTQHRQYDLVVCNSTFECQIVTKSNIFSQLNWYRTAIHTTLHNIDWINTSSSTLGIEYLQLTNLYLKSSTFTKLIRTHFMLMRLNRLSVYCDSAWVASHIKTTTSTQLNHNRKAAKPNAGRIRAKNLIIRTPGDLNVTQDYLFSIFDRLEVHSSAIKRLRITSPLEEDKTVVLFVIAPVNVCLAKCFKKEAADSSLANSDHTISLDLGRMGDKNLIYNIIKDSYEATATLNDYPLQKVAIYYPQHVTNIQIATRYYKLLTHLVDLFLSKQITTISIVGLDNKSTSDKSGKGGSKRGCFSCTKRSNVQLGQSSQDAPSDAYLPSTNTELVRKVVWIPEIPEDQIQLQVHTVLEFENLTDGTASNIIMTVKKPSSIGAIKVYNCPVQTVDQLFINIQTADSRLINLEAIYLDALSFTAILKSNSIISKQSSTTTALGSRSSQTNISSQSKSWIAIINKLRLILDETTFNTYQTTIQTLFNSRMPLSLKFDPIAIPRIIDKLDMSNITIVHLYNLTPAQIQQWSQSPTSPNPNLFSGKHLYLHITSSESLNNQSECQALCQVITYLQVHTSYLFIEIDSLLSPTTITTLQQLVAAPSNPTTPSPPKSIVLIIHGHPLQSYHTL
ncbi:hypothetical protein NEHOM01_2028 [Nematocida homosporus]|uniref:uncharacterized protein n=1 Tax=Nematocida homosporus TaxID=1912981 RepID=UPI00221E6D69|nr:uncharacterized protein NEHOM01_2028 [Nematocida homosporus]KAI5187232.1 hypothetical protein NEHOM01_2028 [Nematocida homosporus]